MAVRRHEELTSQDENGSMYCPSVEIALFSDAPRAEIAEQAIACYRLCLERFGSQLQLYLASAMMSAQKLTAARFEVFPTLCADPKLGTLPMYRAWRGGNIMDYNPPVFMTGGLLNKQSCLQVHLPAGLADQPEEILAFVAELCVRFPFRVGYAGLGLCWNDLVTGREVVVPSLIKPLLLRHPGLSPGLPRQLSAQPMPPVNWLTLLGPGLLQAAGGLDRLRRELSDDGIAIVPMGDGVCIRAGEAPMLGDTNRQDHLPLYHKVGALLKPHRPYQKLRLKGMDYEETEAWLARFDA